MNLRRPNMIRKETIIALAFALGLTAGTVQAKPNRTANTTKIEDQVRRQIATVPYANVWDWIEAEVGPDGSVTLQGEVTQPSVKADAESRVRSLEAVPRVVNDIRVLPLSYSDNAVRLGVYRALFNANSPLTPYALGG